MSRALWRGWPMPGYGIALLALPAAADVYPRQPGVDAVHYVFRLTLGDASDQIEGEASVSLRFVQDGVQEEDHRARTLALPCASRS